MKDLRIAVVQMTSEVSNTAGNTPKPNGDPCQPSPLLPLRLNAFSTTP
jgi:hypothetical protein